MSEYEKAFSEAVEEFSFSSGDRLDEGAKAAGQLAGQVAMYRARAAYWEARAVGYKEQLDWLKSVMEPWKINGVRQSGQRSLADVMDDHE